MNILYYNEYFRDNCGAYYHAYGLLKSFYNSPKINKLSVFPTISNLQECPPKSHQKRIGYSTLEQLLRFSKREIQSYIRYYYFLNKPFLRENRRNLILLARVSPFDNAPLLISKKMGIPLIAEWNAPFFYEIGKLRNGSLNFLIRRWEKKFLLSSTMVYTVSNQLKKILISEYKLPNNKIFTIPNGFDPDIFPKNELSFNVQFDSIRKKAGWDNSTVIAFVGSLKVWHGIKNIIRIAEYFSKHDNSIKFVIIGDGEDRESIIQANKHRNIQWFGSLPIKKMAEYLTGCDLGIMPYQPIKNFYFSPLKLYDFMGACLPSIGYSVGQIKEVYTNHPEAGWTIEKGTPNEYIQIIKHLHKNKKKITDKKKKLAISRLNHTWKVRSDELIDIFSHLKRIKNAR